MAEGIDNTVNGTNWDVIEKYKDTNGAIVEDNVLIERQEAIKQARQFYIQCGEKDSNEIFCFLKT